MLDERFRRLVQEVADADEGALGPEAHERILRCVVAEGPGLVRRARRQRSLAFAAGPLLAAAAAVAVLVGHRKTPVAAAPAPRVAAVAAAPACAARPAHPGASFVTEPDGARLDLGTVAVAAATAGSTVALAEAAPCRTVITLGSGTVAVHAKDLGGGELRVRAPGGEVTVHGTIFAVTQQADSFTVEVVEGRVTVTDRAGGQTVSTGERLLVSAVGAAEGALSPARAHAIRVAVGVPEVVGLDSLRPFQAPEATRQQPQRGTPPSARAPEAAPLPDPTAANVVLPETVSPPAVQAPPPPVDPLAEAEAARRKGDFQKARELYEHAGEGTGVTAEAAWVALARMELSLGHLAAAREATNRRQARFGQGTLGPEALWIDVRTYRQTGDMDHARALAADLIRRWPSSPQAVAARQWLSGE